MNGVGSQRHNALPPQKKQENQKTKIFKELFSTVHRAASCCKTINDEEIKVLEQSPPHKY
jgi:hypothetical protein